MRRRPQTLLFLCLTLAGTAAQGADPVKYQVNFTPSGDAALDALMKQTSSLVSLAKSLPPAPFALIGRARADENQFLIVLHSRGYDAGRTDITIDGLGLNDPTLLDHLTHAPASEVAKVQVKATQGAVFDLGTVDITGLPRGFQPHPGIAPGQPATAAPILAATPKLLKDLHNAGYAFATVSQPLAVAHPASHRLDVTYSVTPGPRVEIGVISFQGLTRTDPEFLRRAITLHQGEAYSDNAVNGARDTLLGLGVFSSVTAVPQDKPVNGQVPVIIHVTEQKRHAVTLSGAYATDTGFTIGSSWEDRNLFRHAETLTFSVAANGLGGTGTTAPGYDIKAVYAKPDYLIRTQTLSLSAEAIKESLTAYNRDGLILGASLSRPVTAHTAITYGPSLTSERVEQESLWRTYLLAQFPVNFTYNTSNSTLEPTRGVNLSLTVTPTYPIVGNHNPFVIIFASGSTYLPVERNDFGIIALHGVLGSIQGASQFEVPADQRFYAGGSGTVRGYTYQTVGPLYADDDPEGGLAIDAINLEFRQHITKSIGIVPFVDAAQVSTSATPFAGHLSVGAGLGARYYTSIGPIRADFAIPLQRTPGSSAFAIYVGLGEAF